MDALLRSEHGATTVEYLIVLALVVAGLCAAIAALAPRLLALFVYQQALLLAPFP